MELPKHQEGETASSTDVVLPVWSYRPCPLGSTALKLVVLSLPDQSETALGAPSSSQSPIHPSQREVPSSWAEGKSRG